MENSDKRGVGRPTSYKQEYCEQAYNYCLLGATDETLAMFFDVNEDTIYEWKKVHPEFSDSITRGKYIADGEVAKSLFKRATGYEHQETKFFVVSTGDFKQAVVERETTTRYPPDTHAASFWLKNRQPKLWRDKQEIDLLDARVITHVTKDKDGRVVVEDGGDEEDED